MQKQDKVLCCKSEFSGALPHNFHYVVNGENLRNRGNALDMGNTPDIGKIWPGWEISEYIGEGAFGKVYKIVRQEFGHNYESALKVLAIPSNKGELASILNDGYDEEGAEAYFRGMVEDIAGEFVLMSRLRGNSNVVSYEDHIVIPHETGIGWDIYLRMELLTPLFDYIREHPLSVRDVIQLGIDICQALEACQKYNIIHRDIKPENIFVSDLGQFKLGDFGIARKLEKPSSGLSKKGTYGYMAPEVYHGEEYNATVDIYSLGIVLYRFLNNNRLPFLPPYPQPIHYLDRDKANMRRFGGEQPESPCNAETRLSEVVLKACAYQPGERFGNAGQMRMLLQEILISGENEELDCSLGDRLENEENRYVSVSRSEGAIDILSMEDMEPPGEDMEKTQGLFGYQRIQAQERERKRREQEERERKEQEERERKAEEERKERERKAEEERKEKERKAEEERKERERREEEERKEKERKAEKERRERERKAEEERREKERKAEEERKKRERREEEERKKEEKRRKQQEEKQRREEEKRRKQQEKKGHDDKRKLYITALCAVVVVLLATFFIQKSTHTKAPESGNWTFAEIEAIEASLAKKDPAILSGIRSETEKAKETIEKETKPVEVPKVVGMLEKDARKQLEGAGFQVTVVEEETYNDAVMAGIVVNQDVNGGKRVLPGSNIRLTVSKGPQPEESKAEEEETKTEEEEPEQQETTKPKSSGSSATNQGSAQQPQTPASQPQPETPQPQAPQPETPQPQPEAPQTPEPDPDEESIDEWDLVN